MGIEIERKYIVADDAWRRQIEGSVHMRQGYFRTAPESTVRVRLIEPTDAAADADPKGLLTIKGVPSEGVRTEFEYTIPPGDVERMLEEFCGDRFVEKVRHTVEYAGHTWVVDVFEGDNAPLVMAEIELETPDETCDEPDWLGEEVSRDSSYTNAALARRPYSQR